MRGDGAVEQPGLRALPGAGVAPPAETVLGVPLEPGERVVFFVRPNHTAARVALVAIGVVFLVALFGAALVAYGVLYPRWALRFVAVTNRRLVVKKGERAARSIALADVVAVKARRSAGGLVAPKGDAKEALTDPAYWATADLLLVQGRRGSMAIDRSADLERLAPVVARGAFEHGWIDRMPAAHHPP